jgi:tetratricopeptide (TPR) repeat protein
MRIDAMAGDLASLGGALARAEALLEGRDEPFWSGMCLYFASLAAFSAGRVFEADRLIADSVTTFRRSGERWSLFNALLYGGTVHEIRGQLDEAAAWYGEALVQVAALRFRGAEARARVRLASVTEARGDPDTAAQIGEQCVELARELDDGTLLNATRVVLARIGRARGDLGEADVLTDAVLHAPEIRQRDMRITALNERGFVLSVAGRGDAAKALFREVLEMERSSRDARFVATALEGVAGTLPEDDATRAAMLLGAAESARGAPVPGMGADRRYVDGVAARARAAGDQQFERAFAAGRHLSAEEAIELALRDDAPA